MPPHIVLVYNLYPKIKMFVFYAIKISKLLKEDASK